MDITNSGKIEKILYVIAGIAIVISLFSRRYMKDYGMSNVALLLFWGGIAIAFISIIIYRTRILKSRQTPEDKNREETRNRKIVKWILIIFLILVAIGILMKIFW